MPLNLRSSSSAQNSLYIEIISLRLVLSLSLLKVLNLIYPIQFFLNHTLFQGIVLNHFVFESLMIVHPLLNGYNLIFILDLVDDVVRDVCEWIVAINVVQNLLYILSRFVRVMLYHESFLSLAFFHLVFFLLHWLSSYYLIERKQILVLGFEFLKLILFKVIDVCLIVCYCLLVVLIQSWLLVLKREVLFF
jgi:hypothetical protein